MLQKFIIFKKQINIKKKKKKKNKLVKGIKNFLGNKKTKSKDMVVNDIRIFLSMKKGYYSIEKNI